MTNLLRAVFDTNVFISASLSKNPTSPAKELLHHWRIRRFTLIVCDSLLEELTEKLIAHKIAYSDIVELTKNLKSLGEIAAFNEVEIPALIPLDPDDDIIIACAVAAKADYLVTYDKHFAVLGGEYLGVKIVEPLAFLWAVREKKR